MLILAKMKKLGAFIFFSIYCSFVTFVFKLQINQTATAIDSGDMKSYLFEQ